jgi:DnaJ like chaperone protein
VWGKILGGMTGFALGGPFGAVIGAAFGHAADSGALGMAWQGGFRTALPGQRDQLFAVGVVVISAKLAKCDGPVTRAEIDAFKRCFRIPQEAARDIGRLFDRARESDEDPNLYARRLGDSFANNRGMLEDVLGALFTIARSDAPLNRREEEFLQDIWRGLRLGPDAWTRLRENRPRQPASSQDVEDPYAIMGVRRDMGDEEIRAAWRQLMRENHPDSLASKGVPAAFIASAGEKVARINAAWDRIKRERGL